MTPRRLNDFFKYLNKEEGITLDYSSVMRLFKEWVLFHRDNKRAKWEKDSEAKKSAEKLKQLIEDWTDETELEFSFDSSEYETDSDESSTDWDLSSDADSEFAELKSFVDSIE